MNRVCCDRWCCQLPGSSEPTQIACGAAAWRRGAGVAHLGSTAGRHDGHEQGEPESTRRNFAPSAGASILADDGSIVEGARVVRAFRCCGPGLSRRISFSTTAPVFRPEDRVTPRALTTLLRYVAAQPWGEEFRDTLPIGGVDGTLSDRFPQRRCEGMSLPRRARWTR